MTPCRWKASVPWRSSCSLISCLLSCIEYCSLSDRQFASTYGGCPPAPCVREPDGRRQHRGRIGRPSPQPCGPISSSPPFRQGRALGHYVRTEAQLARAARQAPPCFCLRQLSAFLISCAARIEHWYQYHHYTFLKEHHFHSFSDSKELLSRATERQCQQRNI